MDGLTKVKLRLDFCSYAAARYAVEKWHYSRVVPAGKRITIGVWEDKEFVGSVIFGLGANRNLGKRFKLGNFDRCELTRVALKNNRSHPTSKVVAIAIKMLLRHSPGMLAIFSYADIGQGHIGTIYQAGGWIYLGKSHPQSEGYINGKRVHKRTISQKFGSFTNVGKIASSQKHLYALAFDDSVKLQMQEVRLPYPSRAVQLIGL